MDRQLAQRGREHLTGERDRERPVDEQQHARGRATLARMDDDERDREAEAEHRLHRRDRRGEPVLGVRRAGPLDEQPLVLAPERDVDAARARGRRADQRVEVEARQRTRVRAHPQLALGDRAPPHERRDDRCRGERERERRGARHERDHRRGRRRDLGERAHRPRARERELAQLVQHVAALGHVGGRPAADVVQADARQLREQPVAQAQLGAATEPRGLAARRHLDEQHRDQERDQRGERARELRGGLQIVADFEQAAEQRHLADDARRGDEDRDGERDRAQAPRHRPEHRPPRPRRRLGERGLQIAAGRRRRAHAGDLHEDRAADPHGVRIAGRARGPVAVGDHPVAPGGVGGELLDEQRGIARDAELGDHPRRGIERGDRPPRRIDQRRADQPRRVAHAERAQPRRQRRGQLLGRGDLAPRRRRDVHLVDVQLVDQVAARHPAPAARRIHHLHAPERVPPQHDEVGRAVRQPRDRDRRHRHVVGHRHVIDRREDLLRVEAELDGDLLERVDRRAVDVGLARLAEPAVAGGDAVAAQQRGEARRSAVHAGGLDDLGDEPARAHWPRSPIARSSNAAGLARSTSTSTTPVMPCLTAIAGSPSSSSSTRIAPSRSSLATRVTRAATVP